MAKQEFINAMSKIVQDVYKQYNSVLPSVCIAQAALESGWRTNCQTLFGIKGKGNTLRTQEFMNGKFVTVSAEFKSYSNLTEAVIQYYDLMSTARYSAVKKLKDPEQQIKFIHMAGYATDPDYAKKIMKIIASNNLTQFDTVKTSTRKSNDEIAAEVRAGLWGNGARRRAMLQQAGYDYKTIQNIVNTKYYK